MLAISFVMLLAINLLQVWGRKRMMVSRSCAAVAGLHIAEQSPPSWPPVPGHANLGATLVRWLLITVSLTFLGALLAAPLAAVFAMALEKGWDAYF